MTKVLEQLDTYTPLGIRFWDPALNRHIRHDLQVKAYPTQRPQTTRLAYRTVGDAYAFDHLPGLRHIEYSEVADDPGSPPERHPYVVCVEDVKYDYLPVAFEIELPLPYAGLYLSWSTVGSPNGTIPPGLHLYSSVARPVPSWLAAVHGELHDVTADGPAAHAVIRLETLDGDSWYGLADAQGRFVVVLPYPPLMHGFGASPADPGHRPLYEQTWDFHLAVQYEPAVLRGLPGTKLPDYLSVLQQVDAQIYQQAPDSGGISLTSLPIELRFDRNPTVKTDGHSQLLVSPSISSP
jgi:hypothetical protein